eukprot:3630894-Amphidinium_carterae.1
MEIEPILEESGQLIARGELAPSFSQWRSTSVACCREIASQCVGGTDTGAEEGSLTRLVDAHFSVCRGGGCSNVFGARGRHVGLYTASGETAGACSLLFVEVEGSFVREGLLKTTEVAASIATFGEGIPYAPELFV